MLSLVAAVEQSKNITTSSTSSNNNNVWKNKECEDNNKDENNKQDEEEEQDRQHHGNKQANSTSTDFLKSELLDALNRLEREYDYYCQQKDDHHKEIHNHRNKTVNSTKQRNNTRNTSAAYWSSLSTPEGSTTQHPSIQVISKSREGGGVQERMMGIITGSTNELSSSSPGEELSSTSTTTNDKGYEQRHHDIADNCDDGSQSPPQFLLKEDHKNISSPLWRQFYSDDNFEAVEVEDEEDASLEHYESSSFFLFEEDKENEGIYASTASSDQDGGEPFPAFDLFQSAYESSREKCGQILDAVERVNEFLDGIQHQQVKAILVGEPVLEEERRAIEGSGSHLLPEASLDESLAAIGASNNCANSRISNCSISNISSSTSHLPKNEETDVTLTRRQENGHTSNHKTSSKENKDASVEIMMDVVIEEQGKNDERRKATTVPRHPALMMIITPPNMVHPGTAERRYFDTPLSPAADDRCCLIEQGTTSSIDKLLQEIEQEAKQEEIFKKKRRIEILRKRELLLSQERVDVVTKRSAVEGFQRLSRKVMIRKLIRYKRYRQGLNTVERIERAVLLTISLSLWKHFASCKRSAKVILRCLLRRYHLILARRKKREEAAMRFLQNWILLRKDTMMTKIIQKRFMKVAKYTIDAWRLRIHEEKQLEELQSAVVRRSSAVCTIQGFLRILMARRKLVFLRLQAANLSRSASRIQSLWRMSQARKNVRSLKIKYDAIKNNAATKIQKVVRGSKIRSRYIAITRRKSQFSIHDPELDAMLDEDDSIENMLFDIVSAEEDDKRHVFSDCWVPSLPIISHSCNDDEEDRMVGYEDANRHHGESRHIGNVKEDYKNQVHSTSQLSKNGIRSSEEQKLMGEWNIKDQRVLESMIRRRDKMNKTKEMKERTKKLANPMTRFKILMRRVNGKFS